MPEHLYIFVNGGVFDASNGVKEFMNRGEIADLVGIARASAVVHLEARIEPKDLRIDTLPPFQGRATLWSSRYASSQRLWDRAVRYVFTAYQRRGAYSALAPDTPRLAIKQQVGILTVTEVPWHNQVPVAVPSGIRLKKVDGAVVDRVEVTDVTVRIVEGQIGLS